MKYKLSSYFHPRMIQTVVHSRPLTKKVKFYRLSFQSLSNLSTINVHILWLGNHCSSLLNC